MPRSVQTKCACLYCGKEITGSGMTRHLQTCIKRLEHLAATGSTAAKAQTVYHLKIRDRSDSSFWLHLEMNGSAALSTLDRYLRTIWLECCGHLSAFQVARWGDEVPMSRKAEQVFNHLDTLIHMYDFGTTSETQIQVVGSRQGKPSTKHPIALMARNIAPEATCMECDQRATHFCPECTIKEEKSGLLCDEHAEEHPHDDYGGVTEIFNSPRSGMCGYDGPALPPY